MTDRRPLTAAVRRRAWGELGVRPWTFLAVMLFVAAVGLVMARWGDWKHEKWVIEHGTPVTAEVTNIGLARAREGNRDENLRVDLTYTPPGTSTPLLATNDLPRKPGAVVATGDKLQVRIDPNQPDYWTERTEPQPLALVMVTPLMCAGVALACLIIAAIKRGRALTAYRTAEPMRATVIAVRQSPLAPLSKLLSVAVEGGDDRRVRDCYWPNRAGTVHPKQAIDVIVSRHHTFAAAAYQLSPHLIPTDGPA